MSRRSIRVPIDAAGRVVLPQAVRRHFQLAAADRLEIEVLSEGILLRPPTRTSPLTEVDGLLVHDGHPARDLSDAVTDARDERDADLLGPRR